MAIPTNIFETYQAIGAREDLTDFIYNIGPTETPLLSMSGTTSATAKLHEWQTDALSAPNGANAAIEGDDPTLTAAVPTARVNNYTQISTKVFGVTGSNEVTSKAGRDSSLAYEAAKAARELKTDVDKAMSGVNVASLAGSSGVARRSGSLKTWLTSNDSRAGDGVQGGYSGGVTTVATNGTPRTFTQAMLDAVIQLAWKAGGKPSVILAGPTQKTVLSGFAGVGAFRTDAMTKTIVATADTYLSNFGTLNVVPTRHIEETSSVDRDVFVMDPEFHKVAYLRPWQQFDLAKTGDSIRRELLVEWTEEVCTEKAHGVVADLG